MAGWCLRRTADFDLHVPSDFPCLLWKRKVRREPQARLGCEHSSDRADILVGRRRVPGDPRTLGNITLFSDFLSTALQSPETYELSLNVELFLEVYVSAVSIFGVFCGVRTVSPRFRWAESWLLVRGALRCGITGMRVSDSIGFTTRPLFSPSCGSHASIRTISSILFTWELPQRLKLETGC